MAIMWNGSLLPNIDPNGAPYSGLRAYFFDAGTTTPRTVYRDSELGESHDHPVIANASGKFPAVFLPSGNYRLRVETSGGVTLDDVDGISTPNAGDGGGGGGGDTPVELLARTGDYKFRHGTGTHSGWVRAAGRAIGSAASGASERANSDCEPLFLFLWAQDPTLSVSGGRGANAASDWAAAKTITLPDLRLRALVGMASMGNTASTIIPGSLFDNSESGETLGATFGVARVTLSAGQMPRHSHSGVTTTDGAHTHQYEARVNDVVGGGTEYAKGAAGYITSTGFAGAHNHLLQINDAGNDEPHSNVQPSAVATAYIKL